jgi:hypothetical protein
MGPQELADLRYAVDDPAAENQMWPSSVVRALIKEIDRVTALFDGQDDDLDRFIRHQVAGDRRFAVEYLHSGACAKLRAVRHRHQPLQGPDGLYCAWCSHIAGLRVDYPCDTLLDIGPEDDLETLAATRGQGAPRARAIAAMSTPERLVDGIDLSRTYMDRDGVKWCCIGWFQPWGQERWFPMMSTMTGRHPDYVLDTLLHVRGPLTVVSEPVQTIVTGAWQPPAAEILVFSSISAGIEETTEQR